jgi:hypothetical protein
VNSGTLASGGRPIQLDTPGSMEKILKFFIELFILTKVNTQNLPQTQKANLHEYKQLP